MAAVLIVLATSYVPDLVVAFLLALLFVLALDASDTVGRLAAQFGALLGSAPRRFIDTSAKLREAA